EAGPEERPRRLGPDDAQALRRGLLRHRLRSQRGVGEDRFLPRQAVEVFAPGVIKLSRIAERRGGNETDALNGSGQADVLRPLELIERLSGLFKLPPGAADALTLRLDRIAKFAKEGGRAGFVPARHQ